MAPVLRQVWSAEASLPHRGRRVTVCVTAAGLPRPRSALLRGPDCGPRPDEHLARLCMCSGRDAASDRLRRASAWGRRVADERCARPVGSWLDSERAPAGPRSSVFSLCGGVEPSGAVLRGASTALPVVPRRQPSRPGSTSRAHRAHHPRDRTRPAGTPRSLLPAMPHDVVAPRHRQRHLYGGRSHRPPGLSGVPATARGAPGVLPTRLTRAHARSAAVRLALQHRRGSLLIR